MCVIWGEISQSAQFLVGAGDFSRAWIFWKIDSLNSLEFFSHHRNRHKKNLRYFAKLQEFNDKIYDYAKQNYLVLGNLAKFVNMVIFFQ